MSPAIPLTPAELGAAFSQGALLMGGLIAAIGAQNALVLRQGAQRQHVLPVVVVCTLSDWLLVALGVFGLGALIASQPLLLEAFRYGGAAFLLAYGWRAARSAWHGSAVGLQLAGGSASLRATLGSTLALTYLNPHVYLDTVVLVGGIGAQQAGGAKLGFVAGAWAVSAAWFAVLGFGAASVSGWLRRPAVWRAIDASVVVVMWAVAVQLLLKPVQGI